MGAFWRRGLILLTILVLLVRCGELAATPTQPPTEPTAAPPARITLTLWHGESGAINETLQRLLLDYQRNPAHSTIEIRVESHGTNLLRDYKAAVLAGGSPDLVLLAENRWIGPLAEQKLVLDITSRITSTEQAAFQPTALDGARFNQKLYGLPLTLDLPVLYYNRANISEALPDSTAEWLAAARSFTTDTNQGLAYNLSLYFTQPYASAFDAQFFDQSGEVVLGTTSFTPTLEWLTWVRDLSSDQLLLARDDNRMINRAIQQNTALMTIDWARNLPDYRQVWGDNVGVRPLPRLSQTAKEPQPYVRSSVLALNPRSAEAQQNAAFEVMRFLTGPTAQAELRSIGLPTVRRDLAEADLVQTQIELAASRGAAWPTSIRFNNSWDTLAAMLRNVLNGAAIESTIAEADRRLRSQ